MSQARDPARTAVEGGVGYLDSRFGSAAFLRRNMKKVFPDHWSYMLGEIALYSFVVLLLTGVFLTFFYEPSMREVVYHGSYEKYQGVKVSAAYASTLHITFDVRGGLLVRQMHHWATLVFVAAIFVHMLRIFFTGAFRKPRELNWVIGFTMLLLAIVNGFIGYALPDDLLSGIGLRITQGMILGIPLIGTYASFIIFGGEFPGHEYIARFFAAHVLLIPGILLALVTAHMLILWHQKHTQFPGQARTNRNVVGQPFYPYFMAKTGAFFFFTFGVLALLGAFAQINPIWLYGPYSPANVFAGAQPDFYVGFLEGAVRLMPGLETQIFGFTISWSIIIPAFIVPGLLITPWLLYPFVEQWATGDKRHHHVLDRPRNAPTRTAFGAASMTVYGVLWAGGGNDIIAFVFDISLQATTWFLRGMFFVGPVVAFLVTRRICLGLQRKDREALGHGYESGIIERSPEGGFSERHETVPDRARAVLGSKPAAGRIEAPGTDESGVPEPGGMLGKVRAKANHFYTNDDVDVAAALESDGHANGHDDGHSIVHTGGNGDGLLEGQAARELTDTATEHER